MTQYSLALRHWRLGYEILATAHLYIGIETLTKAVIDSQLAAPDISKEKFACSLGVNPRSLKPCDSLDAAIEVAARKHILFQGDDQCYRDAKAASDGFEHGYMPFDKIRYKSRGVRDKTAAYLRKAILDLVAIKGVHQGVLLATPYDIPLGNWPIVKYIRGQLLGDSDNLASKTNEYPIMKWRSTIKSIEPLESGDYNVKFEETLTPCLGDGISFKKERFQVWGP